MRESEVTQQAELRIIRRAFAKHVLAAAGVSDVRVLARQVEGVILVLRHGRASRDAAQDAVRMLTSARSRVLGVVLNHADVRAAGRPPYRFPNDDNGHGA